MNTVDVLGRPGAQPASATTTLRLDVMGLEQWGSLPLARARLPLASTTELMLPP